MSLRDLTETRLVSIKFRADVVFEGLGGAVDAVLDLLLDEFGESPLHQVQPRRARGREVQVKARVHQQPLLHVRRHVGRVVSRI